MYKLLSAYKVEFVAPIFKNERFHTEIWPIGLECLWHPSAEVAKWPPHQTEATCTVSPTWHVQAQSRRQALTQALLCDHTPVACPSWTGLSSTPGGSLESQNRRPRLRPTDSESAFQPEAQGVHRP